jgi:hypothetical protein
MTKDELMKLAEEGVRVELRAIQARLTELAKAFPHIVGHQDGTVPAVLPVELKKKSGYAAAQLKRRPMAESVALVHDFLKANPGAPTSEVQRILGLATRTATAKVLHAAKAKKVNPKRGASWEEFKWRL